MGLKIGTRVKVVHADKDDKEGGIFNGFEGHIAKHPETENSKESVFVDFSGGVTSWLHPDQLKVID